MELSHKSVCMSAHIFVLISDALRYLKQFKIGRYDGKTPISMEYFSFPGHRRKTIIINLAFTD